METGYELAEGGQYRITGHAASEHLFAGRGPVQDGYMKSPDWPGKDMGKPKLVWNHGEPLGYLAKGGLTIHGSGQFEPGAEKVLDEWLEAVVDIDAQDAIEGRKEFVRKDVERE